MFCPQRAICVLCVSHKIHILWGSRLTTTKGRELLKVIQEQNYSYLTTGTPTYWPTDGNKTPDLLDFFVTKGISPSYADIQPYDLTSDHSPVIATISTSIITRKPTPRLHNSKTNWETYRQIIQEKAKLPIKLKDQEHVELETNNLINMLQNAAKEATPNSEPQRATNNVPYEIGANSRKEKIQVYLAKNPHPLQQEKIQPNKQQIKIQTSRIAERIIQSLRLQPQNRR